MTDDGKAGRAAAARNLMRGCAQAALATLVRPGGDGEGWPSPSLVLTGFAPDGSPLLLISGLADHTRNLLADPRCGLLFDGTVGHADRLTGPRLSVQGRAEREDDPSHLRRFLARHPSAQTYAGFGDFALWRVMVMRGHMVAGFGRVHALTRDDLCLPTDDCLTLAAMEADIIAHMNQDHGDALTHYATNLLGLAPGNWLMTGIDPDGIDLRCAEDTARLPFTARVTNSSEARAELVRLATQGDIDGPLTKRRL